MNTEIPFNVLCRQAGLSQEHSRSRSALLKEFEEMSLRTRLSFLIHAVVCMRIFSRHLAACLQAYKNSSICLESLILMKQAMNRFWRVHLHQDSADGLISRDPPQPEYLRQGNLDRIPPISLKLIG